MLPEFMISNDVLRSIRYMLKFNETKMVEIVRLAGGEVTLTDMTGFLKKEEEVGFIECDDLTLSYFLNGLIYFKRGKDESRPPLVTEPPTNNGVLKKLRVAFELRDDDVMAVIKSAGFGLSKTELSAFFRKDGHPNYRECGDQVLRYFLKGLTKKVRVP